jgi:hypothetical protein
VLVVEGEDDCLATIMEGVRMFKQRSLSCWRARASVIPRAQTVHSKSCGGGGMADE